MMAGMADAADAADPVLIVVDVQRGFGDLAYWGARDNPGCEANIARLIDLWSAHRLPVVLVRHDSAEPASPLRPGQPGNDLQDVVAGAPHELLVTKRTNSAFYGAPDLHAWLKDRGATSVVVCGITTNHCCETTARMAGNLGYATAFVTEATHTFDRRTPDGELVPAATLARVTAANLHGEFAEVVTVDQLAARLG